MLLRNVIISKAEGAEKAEAPLRAARERRLGSSLRLLAADGSFVPVPTRAEVLLFGPHDLLQRAHVGPGRGGPRTEHEMQEGGGQGEREGGQREGRRVQPQLSKSDLFKYFSLNFLQRFTASVVRSHHKINYSKTVENKNPPKTG